MEDYIGVIDKTPYYGGIYTNVKAVDILTDIFEVAKVPYAIDEEFSDVEVTGYIPYTSCRTALMQVAFAIQAIVDTSNIDGIKIAPVKNDIKQNIPLERIMQGQSFTENKKVTGLEISVHSYKPISENINVYESEKSGIGENIFIKFSEPLHDLNIINGIIVESGNNYAVINAEEGCLLTGQKYEHTKQTRHKKNPLVLVNDVENVVSIDSATLVSKSNIDNIIEKCYDWITKTRTVNMKIIDGKNVFVGDHIKYGTEKYGTFKYGSREKIVVYDETTNVGDNISCETEFLGELSGRIVKQSFSLNGGIIIKDTQLR
jgi:hypothetical protein